MGNNDDEIRSSENMFYELLGPDRNEITKFFFNLLFI
jgi:hypothetical protein